MKASGTPTCRCGHGPEDHGEQTANARRCLVPGCPCKDYDARNALLPWCGTPKLAREYGAYHRKVVEACVRLMGEAYREFFDKQCDYVEECAQGIPPEDVARGRQRSFLGRVGSGPDRRSRRGLRRKPGA
jgi:hypothetical protein